MNEKAVDLNALSKCFNKFSGNNINQKLFQYLLSFKIKLSLNFPKSEAS